MTSSHDVNRAKTMKSSVFTASMSSTTGNFRVKQTPAVVKRQIKTRRRKSAGASVLRAIITHFFWSSRRDLIVNAILCNITCSTLAILLIVLVSGTNGDEELMQIQRPEAVDFAHFQQQQQAFNSGFQEQREAGHLNQFNELFNSQRPELFSTSAESNYHLNQPEGFSGSGELTLVSNMLNQLKNQEQRHGRPDQMPGGDPDLLEAAQTRAQSNFVSSSFREGEEKSTAGSPPSSASAAAASSSQASSSSTSSSTSSSSSSPSSATQAPASPSPSSSSTSGSHGILSDQLSVVSNLIQQAGQLGLTAAQQNVALSEAIINGVTNTLIRSSQNRKQSTASPASAAAPAPSTTASASRPNRQVVGQSIDGNIEYDPNQNAINGFIEFPNLNFSNAKPGINAALKAFLIAGLKTVPIKLGAIGWKLIQLLAWKKIYKTHHPKSGEIIIEQEMGKQMDKGGKYNIGKMGKELSGNSMKTSKMGQSYAGDDWMSMLRSAGGMHDSDMFSAGGWPQASSDSPSASASMIYQRHLLPYGYAASAAAGQPTTAAAAAAAATAAAIQSHWMHQQHLMSEESDEGPKTRTNHSNSSAKGDANALKRKKASFGGANWFAATPAQAYAAAAAAANTAASLASQQQQQQHHHRLSHMMRAYEMGAHPEMMQMVASGQSAYGGGPVAGYMHPGLFDNAAAMAVQNAVKLPPTTESQNPLSTAEFLDHPDSLTGSATHSPFSSFSGPPSEPSDSVSLLHRQDAATDRVSNGLIPPNYLYGHSPGYGSSTDGSPSSNSNLGSFLNSMADFDDTPAGKILGQALNESATYPVYHMINRMDK